MRLSLAALPLLALTADDLTPAYEAGQTLVTEVELLRTSETTEFEILRDGEPVEGRGMRGGGLDERTVTFVQRDELLEASEGRPTKVRREFTDLSRDQVFSFGEGERTIAATSPFDVVVLLLSAGDDGELAVEVEEGSAPEAERLDVLRLANRLDGLLPEGAVEVGESWELSADAIARVLLGDLVGALFEVEQPEGFGGGQGPGGGRPGGGGRGQRSNLDDVEWEGEATLASSEDGQAVVELVLEASGDLPQPEGGFGRRAFGLAPALDNTYEHRLEGELTFDLEARRPVSLELEGTLVWRTERSFERNGSTTEIRSTREGTYGLTVTVTSAE